MHDLNHNEDRPRGTYEFPFEFHHIDHTHPRYVMSYHWHVEYEIIRILEGSLTVTLDEKNYANPITLQELSASVSMSPKYFCRFFSEMTHQTPVDYLNRQRIEEACLQLAATDDSITEIAYRNGFNDLSYFIRTFKKYKGMTPGKYKRR